ncbi:acylneuraminate cytidylyltransferase family protein [Thermosynechococcaceae cyanobacterium BACA0444]|uniref:Acylneuraminate cytidylyltransferase family protein n=1 Tax=Pseudocalidococcus azoricus BACA0444 TaxID=2918990 RepID=A0AAE4FNA6_9CYAN|nr:acylneuraminate cytidylyltransferase family protein [Pseudocalidococcus azoricus]MDS3859248.1 acylneuraminate cytidylyltransferase family protein [Pseudocalidococcus azoricus BACA0444]
MTVTCFLPCRQGSERIKNKNIKPFAGFNHGLIEIKINQLANVDLIDTIVLSTNDNTIIEFAKTLSLEKLVIDKRDDSLCASQTRTDDLIHYVSKIIDQGHILWTHVTSPFLTSKSYVEIIKLYFKSLDEGYDSLMTTTELRSFIWNQNGPVNYDRVIEKWPRTQTITPLHEVNSGAFLCDAYIYKNYNDRIGENPFLYTLDKIQGFDIDWDEDFIIAESLLDKKVAYV